MNEIVFISELAEVPTDLPIAQSMKGNGLTDGKYKFTLTAKAYRKSANTEKPKYLLLFQGIAVDEAGKESKYEGKRTLMVMDKDIFASSKVGQTLSFTSKDGWSNFEAIKAEIVTTNAEVVPVTQ
jgi:hypothetical protein